MDTTSKRWMEPSERLPLGNNLDCSVWKTLNRLRAGVRRSKENGDMEIKLQMWTRADNITPTCLPTRAKPMYTRVSHDKQQEGAEYDSILDKKKYITNMQCILSYTLPLY